MPAVTFTYDLSPMQVTIAWLGLALGLGLGLEVLGLKLVRE